MKKKLLMSLALLAIIGTSAVFAQQPTLDKLKITKLSGSYNSYQAEPLNKDISGAVVIPATYEGLPVVIGSFAVADKITSVTIPAGVKWYSWGFNPCPALISVTFGGSDFTAINGSALGNSIFPGDLVAKYRAGGEGTYTRQAGSNTWTKQGGGFSLNGTWTRSDGMKITISENGQNITITGDKPNNGGKLNDTYTKR
jgi:hypothetical protein